MQKKFQPWKLKYLATMLLAGIFKAPNSRLRFIFFGADWLNPQGVSLLTAYLKSPYPQILAIDWLLWFLAPATGGPW